MGEAIRVLVILALGLLLSALVGVKYPSRYRKRLGLVLAIYAVSFVVWKWGGQVRSFQWEILTTVLLAVFIFRGELKGIKLDFQTSGLLPSIAVAATLAIVVGWWSLANGGSPTGYSTFLKLNVLNGLVVACALAPVVEEFLFRHVLFDENSTGLNLVSSGVFAAIHVLFSDRGFWGLLILFFLAQWLVRVRANCGLVSCILVHSAYNLSLLLLELACQ